MSLKAFRRNSTRCQEYRSLIVCFPNRRPSSRELELLADGVFAGSVCGHSASAANWSHMRPAVACLTRALRSRRVRRRQKTARQKTEEKKSLGLWLCQRHRVGRFGFCSCFLGLGEGSGGKFEFRMSNFEWRMVDLGRWLRSGRVDGSGGNAECGLWRRVLACWWKRPVCLPGFNRPWRLVLRSPGAGVRHWRQTVRPVRGG